MSLEHTKHTNEKDLHRNLPSVRDIRTLLLHCSLVTPNQQLKHSFQMFAAPPGSDRSGVIAKDLFKSLILSAVSLGDIGSWMQATRFGRVDFAEVCRTSDSLLSGAVTSIGGCVVQHSHWNGFDLTTKADTEELKEDLPEKRPRVVCMTPCTTKRTQQSQ